MRFVHSACIAIAIGACGATALPARAADAAANAPAPLDPALKRELNGVAAALLLAFGSAMAGGSAEGFDPGPALERAIGRLLTGPEADALLDRLAGQVARGGEADGLSPEMRAAIAVALRGMISMARREMARDLPGR